MNLLLATMQHETTTFAPVPGLIERFHGDGRLHELRGGVVTETRDDGEGELPTRIRDTDACTA